VDVNYPLPSFRTRSGIHNFLKKLDSWWSRECQRRKSGVTF